MMLRVNQHSTCQQQQLLPMHELCPCTNSAQEQCWEECAATVMATRDGRGAVTHYSTHAHLWRFLSAPHHWFLPQFPRTGLSIHTRERKLVFPVSFLPAHVFKALLEENCQTPQVINVITLDPHVPWACCCPWGPTTITAFSWKRLRSISENKITNLIPKISQQSSVSVPHLPPDESERVTLARSKNVTGKTTAKPQALFLSSVCYTTLFSSSGHSGDGSPPSAYRLVVYISDFFLMHLCM